MYKRQDKVKWDDKTRKELYDLAAEVNKMDEGHARNMKIGEMQQKIDNIFPSALADKAVAVWKAGLLTSFRTHERNILGSGINTAAEQVSFTPAAIADRIMSWRTKERTLVASTGEGMFKGMKQGAKLGADQIRTGIDVTNSNLKYNFNHVTWGDNGGEKALKTYTEAVFRTLGAEDKIYREAARENSYINQAYTDAVNKKLKGKAFDEHVEKLVKNPTAKMKDVAEADAGRATFTHENRPAELIKGFKDSMRRSNKPGAKALSVALEFVFPFTQTPGGVASQLYEYSPARLVTSMAQMLSLIHI